MTTIDSTIAGIFHDAGTRGYLHAVEIGGDGAEVSFGADTPVVMASTFKIAVLVAYARAVADGTIDPREKTTVTARYRIGGVGFAGFADDVTVTWRDLALNMMSMSDNAATDVIYHRVGDAAVQRVLTDLTLSNTRIMGCCEDLFRSVVTDLGASPDDDLDTVFAQATPERMLETSIVDPQRTSSSTPRDMTTLLRALWTNTAAPAGACESARTIMAQQIWPHRLTSGFPFGVTIAAKTGTVPTWRNEAGVVTYPDGRQFAVAVYTRAFDSADRLPAVDASIGKAAFAAVEHLRSTSPTK